MPSIDNRRILIVDDNAAIHQDFRKILLDAPAGASAPVSEAESALFDDDAPATTPIAVASATATSAPDYTLDSALQGQEALERVQQARKEGLPYALVFLDVRMPPGWDGIETAQKLWEADPELQIVLCTAYSDYSWQETVAALGRTDRLLILKKPFDRVEVCQFASALTEKWNLVLRERQSLQTAVRAEMEARAYAASLETMNHALETSWAKAESELKRRGDYLMRIASEVLAPAQLLLVQRVASESARTGADRLVDPAIAIASAITHVLDLAAMDVGVAKVTKSPARPVELARQVATAEAELARQRNVRLEFHCAPGVPQELVTDVPRVTRILTELVENALRHTTEGSVELRLDVQPSPGHDGQMLRCQVRDSGPGLSNTARARLFEPFNPGDSSRSGLGLAASKRSAHLIGGDLYLEPTESGGASFALVLPLRAD